MEVVKDESMERMMALGLMATPGVAIDGKVVMSGRIPKAEEVRLLGALVEAGGPGALTCSPRAVP